VYIKEHEWLEVAAWVYKHFDMVSGVAFLPFSGSDAPQAPYQECDEDMYNEMVGNMPENINWLTLKEYEKVDTTEGMQEFACTGTSCEFTGV
jgi:ribonucleoside-diphosphate reductase alpha chain